MNPRLEKLRVRAAQAALTIEMTKQAMEDDQALADWLDAIANALDEADIGELAKFDPDQPRDQSGKWTSTGGGAGAKAGAKAPGTRAIGTQPNRAARLVAWAKSPSGRSTLIKGAAVAALTAGVEVPEHAAVHRVVEYVVHHVGIEGAMLTSAATVAIKHAVHSLGLSAEKAKHFLVHLFRESAKAMRTRPRARPRPRGGVDLNAPWPYGPRQQSGMRA